MKKFIFTLVFLVFASSLFAAAADVPSVSAMDVPEIIPVVIDDSISTTDMSQIADTKGEEDLVDLSSLKNLTPAFANIVLKGLVNEAAGLVVRESEVIEKQYDIIALVKESGLSVIPYAQKEEAETEVRQDLESAYEDLSQAVKLETIFEEDVEEKEGYKLVATELFAYKFSESVNKVMDENDNSLFVVTIAYNLGQGLPVVGVRTSDGRWLEAAVKFNDNGTITLYLPAEGPIVFLEYVKI